MQPDHEVLVIGGGFSGIGAAMMSRRHRQIFSEPSCQAANTYYFDENGDTPFRASTTLETMWRSGHFPLEDYEFAPA